MFDNGQNCSFIIHISALVEYFFDYYHVFIHKKKLSSPEFEYASIDCVCRADKRSIVGSAKFAKKLVAYPNFGFHIFILLLNCIFSFPIFSQNKTVVEINGQVR